MLELLAKNEAPPIEVCPTSNLITLGHRGYDDHPYLAQWLALGYPLSINTDDRGIFNTTLTEELLRVMDAQRLDLADMVQIIGKSSRTSSIERMLLTLVRYRRHYRPVLRHDCREGQAYQHILGDDRAHSAGGERSGDCSREMGQWGWQRTSEALQIAAWASQGCKCEGHAGHGLSALYID